LQLYRRNEYIECMMRFLYHNVLQWIGFSMRDWDPFRPFDSVLCGAFHHICGSTVQLPLLWDFLGILGSGSPGCSLVKDSGSFSDFLNSSVCNTHIFPLYQAASFTIAVSKAERVVRAYHLCRSST
jgi:hypothetical protein